MLFISCSTSNKVVSSFGKRKYTKGYYFNYGSHKSSQVPVLVENKILTSTPKTSSGGNICSNQRRKVSGNKISASNSPITQLLSPITKKEAAIFRVHQDITSRITNEPTKEIKSSYLSAPYGARGHGGTTNQANTKADKQATTGFIFGLLSIFVFPLFGIPGIIFSLEGLKSEKYHTLAVIGLVISIVWLVLFIGIILLLVFTTM